ncbi:MAG: hypothetical protein AB1432_13550 [Bacteroidota bacterium]
MKRLLTTAFLSITCYACSTSLNSVYKFDYPLTQQRAFSKTTNISVKIPDGWFTAEDNECKCIDLWLIRNDYKQSLNFSLIHLDEETRKNIRQYGLNKLTSYNKIFVKVKFGNSFEGLLHDEIFEINGKQFSAYEYIDKEGSRNRVVLFEHNNNFYELTAVSREHGNNEQLWVIQNSVLTSLN